MHVAVGMIITLELIYTLLETNHMFQTFLLWLAQSIALCTIRYSSVEGFQ